ncbi:MFS transporter [Vreelandella titanicae]|jgi:predicted MFS family arabinose efflux permease|uniref:Major facilitator superfamily, general substrate transporter n=1 Tax=Vreelandella titanicae BH1 TaxID=1204738 RepID=L9UDA9_9GAMM|nr:MFS transporter [Halomonas titanicae]ELY22606.1 Major facilitator superfamily, general substrate transporter [Halomonas titanicae BH1]NVE88835.1 MFS transporter [Halomonas titanicae]|tara:strand:+ start:126 stop:1409 length:1284 start_codon:yes stop_codon:yes gene_type:complete
MKALSNMGFALFGAALVAISYGLARFAFGLFVPSISAELSLTSYLVGIIGALPFISFVLSTLVAPLAADRLGARNLAILSGSFGVGGLALISQSSDALSLGIGVFICGVCTGLMMPALTAAMQALVSRAMHGRVSSIMNAGTSIGIIVAVPTVVFLSDAWRLTYTIFAALTAMGVVAAWYFIPSVSRVIPANAAPPPPITRSQWSRLIRLTIFAFAMGFVSAPYWLFAPDLAVTLGALSPGHTGWLWFAVGIAGLGGAVISDLADRNNPPITQALMLMMLSSSLALLAASPSQLALAIFSAMVFGLAYMSLTGLYLMTGIRLLPGRLSMGPVLPFMACALGQAVGSPVIGVLVDRLGYADAFSIFSVVGILVAVLSPLYPGHIDYLTEEEPQPTEVEDTGLQAAYDHQLLDENGDPIKPVAEDAEAP